MLDSKTIIKLSEELELKGVNHPILESAMVYTFGIDWEKDNLYKEFYKYVKESMHFDNETNTWLDK